MNNRFVFVVPMFNASKTFDQMLYSLLAQSYDNLRVILIDDLSDNKHRYQIESFLIKLSLFNSAIFNKIEIIYNTTKKWETLNVLKGVSLCNDNDIICRLDADDYLTDNDTLHILNNIYYYSNSDLEAAWTAHRWNYTNTNISANMNIKNKNEIYTHPWVSSHLKTFRKHLLNNVSYENFLNQNGEIVKRAGDQAIYLPALYNAKKFGFLPLCTYHYSIDEKNGQIYQSDDAKFQKQEADFIRNRGYVNGDITWQEKFKNLLDG
jgi:glycosyltransferase involved in cell wall biosynthesis